MRFVELSDLYRLRSADLVGASTFRDAVAWVRDDGFWSLWAHRALLALGFAHVLSGIIFFFAYNWADMSPFAKFAVIEVALVVTAVGAIFVGSGKLVGQALLVAASVLVGVLLAVIGQVYQTGADVFELFVAWALLILPWTLFSRSAAQWFTLLVVAYTAACTYSIQVAIPMKWLEAESTALLLGALLTVALGFRETAVQAGFSWMASIWTRYILLFVGMAHFFVAACAYVFELDGHFYSVIILVAAFAGGIILYRGRWSDFPAFSLLVAYGGLFLMVVGGRLVFEIMADGDAVVFGFALLTLWCISVAGGMGKLLLVLRASDRRSAG
ncbi:MAG: DUF2157 domain-containing protein [Hyphomicrobiales bacterium]|nr:DUF2157 domain-containing protein [Hyphomicrobiales bacterium]